MNDLYAAYRQRRKKDRLWLLGLCVLLPFFFLLDVSLGPVSIPLADTFRMLTGQMPAQASWVYIIYDTRLPQSLTALAAGAGLAVAGLMLQTFFRNPLAGPSVLGISSGAMLGVAFVVMGSGWFGYAFSGAAAQTVQWLAAFAGSIGVLMLILLFSRISRDSVTVLIAGLMIGYLAGALVSLLQQVASREHLQQFVFWGFGSFSGLTLRQSLLFLCAIVVMLWPVRLLAKSLNAFLLGDLYARSMGVRLSRFRWQVILITGMLAGTVTAFCGPVAFIGLAVPHLVRRVIRTEDHALLLPSVAVAGALLCLLCSLVSRAPFWEQSLPLNAVTSLIGAPVVIWVILRQQRWKGGNS